MIPTPKSSRTGNRLLDRLPDSEYKRALPALEAVSLPQGNCAMSHVYFPTSGMCSIVGATDEGKGVETATVGNEGMIGVSVLLGHRPQPKTRLVGESMLFYK
jgi:hypothetical protein